MVQPCSEKGVQPSRSGHVEGSCGPVTTHPMGIRILAAGRDGSTTTVPPLPNFLTCGEPCGPDSQTAWALFDLRARG